MDVHLGNGKYFLSFPRGEEDAFEGVAAQFLAEHGALNEENMQVRISNM